MPDTPDVVSIANDFYKKNDDRLISMPADPTASGVINENTASSRATRAAFGLSTITGKTQEDMKDDIGKGREDSLRQFSAFKLDAYNESQRFNAVAQSLAKGVTPPPEILAPAPKADPSTVFEKSFANAMTAQTWNKQDPHMKWNPSWQFAHEQMPDELEALHAFTKESIAKDQYKRQKFEEIQDRASNESWLGWGFHQILGLFQPYNEYMLRGNVEGASKFAGGLLGWNLKEQADTLNSYSTLDEFKPRLDQALESLKGNPELQAKFMAYVFQSEDPTWDNMWTAAMAGGTATSMVKYAKIFKEISNTAKSVKDIAKVVGDFPKEPEETSSPAMQFWGDTGGPVAGGDVKPPSEKLPENPNFWGEPSVTETQPPKDDLKSMTSAAEKLEERIRQRRLTAQEGQTPMNTWAEDLTPPAKPNNNQLNFWADKPPDEQVPTGKGDVSEAAVKSVANDLKANAEAGTKKNSPALRAAEPMAQAFREIERGPTLPGRQELKNRIHELLWTKYAKLYALLNSQVRINRIPDISQNEAAVREVLGVAQRLYPELSGNVLGVNGFIRALGSNNWFAEMQLGQNNAELFESVAHAQAWAKHNNIALTTVDRSTGFPKTEYGAHIRQAGDRFYIVKDLPINETDPIIKQFYGSIPNTQAPWGPIKAFTSWLKTPENTMSAAERAARQIATEGPSAFYAHAQDSIENMAKLSKSESHDLNRMLKVGQERYNPDLDSQGYFFKSIGEYDDAFMREIGRHPSDNETTAYFEFVSNLEMDRWLREASVMRDQLRWGAQGWQISVKNPDGTMRQSPWFSARRVVDKMPGGDTSLAVISGSEVNGKYADVRKAFSFGPKKLQEWQDAIATGQKKLVQIWDTDRHPLKGFGDINETHRVEYVLADNITDRPLAWGQNLARNEGGHLEREYSHYISQARVSKYYNGWTYLGDNNLFGVHNGAEARRLAKIAERVREYKIGRDEAGARKYLNDIGFPTGFQKLWEAFDSSKGTNGEIIPPRLNLHEPIQARSKDEMIIDKGKSALEDRYKDHGGLIDGTRSGNPARSSAIQYAGERDSYDFWGARDIGTKYNPIFTLNQDDFIDAIPMMNRGLGRMINSLYMDDYKISAVQHWLFGASVPAADGSGKLVGAAEYMKATRQEIAAAPWHYFNQPEWKSGMSKGEKLAVMSALEADRMKIKAFIGIPSKIDGFLNYMEQTISDSIYGKFGPKALKLAPLWKLSALSDAPLFLRSVIFNSKMGFFSPRQFFIHAFTFINAALIAPKYAGAGAYAAMLHGWSALNKHPDIIKLMDEKASKFRFPGQSMWKPGEWKEANEALARTGFNYVDLNRLALTDTLQANNVIQSKGKQYLDAGMSPFRAGVKSLKTASWYTAFKEFRDANPVGKLTDDHIEQILLRANDLSHNMSRASTSAVQKGFMTYGAMFSSYNLRLAELLIGKRLSGAEKARLFFGYMGIFGVPTAGGLIGMSSYLRGQVDKGNVPGLQTYVPGYDFTTTAIMEGLLPALVSEMTGHVYDFGESYGAKDLDIVDSALNSDESVWQVFGGATYSTLANTWANSSGFRNAMMSMLRQDGAYTLTADDVVDMFKEISSVNYAWRTYMGMETGKWMSRNGAYLNPTSPQNAMFTGISGLSDQSVPDIYQKSLSIKQQREAEAETFRQYGKVATRWLQAMQDNNPTQAQQYAKQMTWLLNAIPVKDKPRAMAAVSRDNQSLVDRIDWSFVNDRSVPDADRQRRQEQYNKIQEMKQRNQ